MAIIYSIIMALTTGHKNLTMVSKYDMSVVLFNILFNLISLQWFRIEKFLNFDYHYNEQNYNNLMWWKFL
jgi:hypothetical protein